MKKTMIIAVSLLVVAVVCIAPVSAADWSIKDAIHEKFSTGWLSEVKEKLHNIVSDMTKSFQDRVDAQAEALGMTDRLRAYLDAEKDEDGEPIYDFGWGNSILNLFGGGQKASDYPDREEGEALYAAYLENYCAAAQQVDR